ncbi:alpha-L-rhamnosidase [Parastagonospora nodorum]|nr:alpha-L-rhamnosidase [Parastagonospora nodorum]KAH5750241.1 alpha-L-rhamnosidase [Parastagonospora nodorum]KAH5786147.1 alpha-L-rhamnosidase [Parastagonospora nodorum]KAH5797006.1 alpha-L-rhamnosidase [Parastagonospora nodorum]KAH5808059.1 alpha-L-rhamnosidase [Parastagonospora nodorum]
MTQVIDVRFEHYDAPFTIGVDETKPRLSWKIRTSSPQFQQNAYEIEIFDESSQSASTRLHLTRVVSSSCTFVPWPSDQPLRSRQKIAARIRIWDEQDNASPWSDLAGLETGLLERNEWQCARIAAPWNADSAGPLPEQLYRKQFSVEKTVSRARLYITSQGLYEASVNGSRVGDYFLAPGWTSYDGRLQYQTYDITSALTPGNNCLGVRVAEGWFNGRIGYLGGARNIWGSRTSLLAQLEITFNDGRTQILCTDDSWLVSDGPIRLAEIYDGEKYDATQEVPDWSMPTTSDTVPYSGWKPVTSLDPLLESIKLTAGYAGPVRRFESIPVKKQTISPSGKTIIDFDQNLVGYLRLKGIKGPRGHKITLKHAEILEDGELCLRILRQCAATDEYTLRGTEDDGEETYEPRFTFHGFRYAQIDGWVGQLDPSSVEAVVCHTDMKRVGSFSCSNSLLNQLHSNVVWSMRGNFLSVPTDCPQRDERLGWTGDIALFVPTAVLLYDCFGMLKNWLVDLAYDSSCSNGVPPIVCPNNKPIWTPPTPTAIWADSAILLPWNLYLETGDETILSQLYDFMTKYISIIPRNKEGATHLCDQNGFQFGDWVDPAAPPDSPFKAFTDAIMVANMFLIQNLDLMSQISAILGKETEKLSFAAEAEVARAEFQDEYVTSTGRLVSDSQTAYSLAITMNILPPEKRVRAGNRLAELVKKNGFKIATGFAGTPFVCEALARMGHCQVAYAMLLETKCPSWLYPVNEGATTIWERWDSMLPNGKANVDDMTSFNHYAFGSIAKFLYERLAGLQRVDAGWKQCRIAPMIGAEFTNASASHITPRGTVSCEWKTGEPQDGVETFQLKVVVPYGTKAEVVIPEGTGSRIENVGPGEWSFESKIRRDYEWPVQSLELAL